MGRFHSPQCAVCLFINFSETRNVVVAVYRALGVLTEELLKCVSQRYTTSEVSMRVYHLKRAFRGVIISIFIFPSV